MLHSHFTSFYILPIIYNTDLLLDCSQLYIIRSLLTNIAFLYVLSIVGPMMQRFQSFTNTLSFTDAVIVTDIVFMGMKKTFYALLPPSNTWFHWLTQVCRPKQHFDRFSHFCHAHLQPTHTQTMLHYDMHSSTDCWHCALKITHSSILTCEEVSGCVLL